MKPTLHCSTFPVHDSLFKDPFNDLAGLFVFEDEFFSAVMCHFFFYQVVIGIVFNQVTFLA